MANKIELETIPGIPSNVVQGGYDETTSTLRAKFKNGRMYDYERPKSVWDEWKEYWPEGSTPSAGEWFMANIVKAAPAGVEVK